MIVSCSREDPVMLWDISSGNLIREFTDYSYSARSVTFSRDGSQILSGMGGGRILLWNIKYGVTDGKPAVKSQEAGK